MATAPAPAARDNATRAARRMRAGRQANAVRDTHADVSARQLALIEAAPGRALVPVPKAALRRLLARYGNLRAAAAAAKMPLSTLGKVAAGQHVVTPRVRDQIVAAADGIPTALAEDVEWMLDTGESPAGIAERLGITHGSLLRALGPDRHNRPDLVARLTTDPTGLSTGLCIPSRERGRVGGGDGDPGITAGQAAAVTRLVTSRLPAGAAADVLAVLGLAPAPARYGRT